MRKFQFRLETVLRVRELDLKEAEKKWKAKRDEINAFESDLADIAARRMEVLHQDVRTISDRLRIEGVMLRFDEQEAACRVSLSVLRDEEESIRREWLEARMNRDAVQKLKENALLEWKAEFNRFEQNELDEWAQTRRQA